MTAEALFVGIATIAVVIAGFTGITAGLGSSSAGQSLRQRAIVSTSFNVTFESLVPLVLFAMTGDERMSMVIASAGVALYALVIVLVRARQMLRSGALAARGARVMFVAGPLATLLFATNALYFMSSGVFALALLVQLSVAAVSFYTLVANASR
ncbi:MAG: hypothetical protein ABI452_02430 [Candidatus Limnocylindrales bacterium]